MTGGVEFGLAVGDQLTGSVNVSDGGTFNTNVEIELEEVDVRNATLNVNSDVSITGASGIDVRNGVLNLNSGGVLRGDLLVFNENPTGLSSQINQNGGRLDLGRLDIRNDLEVTLGPDDRVSDAIGLLDNSRLTISSDQTLTSDIGVTENATLDLNADLVAGSLRIDGTLNRAAGVMFDVNRLEVTGVEYDLDGTDTVRTFLAGRNGATINVLAPVPGPTVNAFGFNLGVADNSTINVDVASTTDSHYNTLNASGDSDINVNAETRVDNVLGVTDSTLNVNDNVIVGSTNGLLATSSQVNLNGGTITGSLRLLDRPFRALGPVGPASTLTRTGETILALFDLEVSGSTQLELAQGDSVSRSLLLSNGAVVEYAQGSGQFDGLMLEQFVGVDESSTLHFIFDDVLAAEGELDFALRVDLGHLDTLQSLLDAGRITVAGGPDSIGVISDTNRFGDFAYIGYVGVSAVPEPSSLSMLFAATLALAGRRRRRNR